MEGFEKLVNLVGAPEKVFVNGREVQRHLNEKVVMLFRDVPLFVKSFAVSCVGGVVKVYVEAKGNKKGVQK